MSLKTIGQLEIGTKAFIVQAIQDIMNDPDFGLRFTKSAERRFKQASIKKEKFVSLSEIKKQYS